MPLLSLPFFHTDKHPHLCLEVVKHIPDHGLQFLQVAGSLILLLTQCQRYQQREVVQLSTTNLKGWGSRVELPCDFGIIKC